MPAYTLNKWRHPKTEQIRIYLNGLEETEAKVWFDRGDRQGTALPPVYGAKLCWSGSGEIPKAVMDEIAEAFSTMDLFLANITWERLGRAANW